MTKKTSFVGVDLKCPYGEFSFSSKILGMEIFADRIEVKCEDGIWTLKHDEDGEISATHQSMEEIA